MTATLTTKQIKDGAGNIFVQRVLDVSGTGEGPFLPLHGLADPDGSGPIDIGALSTAIIDAISSGAATLPTGAASDVKLDAIITKLSADPATQSTLSSVLSAVQAQKIGSAADPQYGAGLTKVATASLTRPADTSVYASGDLIANSTTAGSVAPLTIAAARANDATGMIRKVRLHTSNTGWANSTIRVHLFKNAPTTAAGDNGALSGAVNGVSAIHLGYFDVTFDQTFSDGVKGEGVPNTGSEINFEPASGTPNIYALMEARGAYTPASGQTFGLAVETLQN